MTTKEAIKWLREAEILDLCSGYTKDREAVNMAISALEKQIPQKPKMVQSKCNNNLWYLYCPSCENYIGTRNGRFNSNNNICPYCGQAIDWEEEG